MPQRGAGELASVNRAEGIFAKDDAKGRATPRERDEVVGTAAVRPKCRSVVSVVERGMGQRNQPQQVAMPTRQEQRGERDKTGTMRTRQSRRDVNLIGRGQQGGKTRLIAAAFASPGSLHCRCYHSLRRPRQYGENAESGINSSAASLTRQEQQQR